MTFSVCKALLLLLHLSTQCAGKAVAWQAAEEPLHNRVAHLTLLLLLLF